MKFEKNTIPVVDLFAGPGGLGEGFSSVLGDPFRIIVSAEMEKSAHQTLRLRAFYRILLRKGGRYLKPYYDYCNGDSLQPFDLSTQDLWEEAGEEALQLTLGSQSDNEKLDSKIRQAGIQECLPWVLIGGPPCQAYSLVGRARNRGNLDYRPEEDHRHFLYREYLRIIQQYRPSVFVMENVKGILSASVGGQRIFHTILQDLADPDLACGVTSGHRRPGYRIHSLVDDTFYDSECDLEAIDPRRFVVRAEDYGVPQARHRVILLGVREDIKIAPGRLKRVGAPSVRDAIAEMPKLRSRLSRGIDSAEGWYSTVRHNIDALLKETRRRSDLNDVRAALSTAEVDIGLPYGGLRVKRRDSSGGRGSFLNSWYVDGKWDRELKFWLNHEARGHMPSDLLRYAYAVCYAQARGRSPKGHEEFDLKGLRPNHDNWESGKFADRFRVQHWASPSTTVTSHIAKDGHYFIHPDLSQCRSLTVREAARLQTFPDNYFFQGNRTQQYHQVGNAVPPLLARSIGSVVHSLITGHLSKVTDHASELSPLAV